ncbi:hypothetical protein [Nocardia sp. NPDC052566]|uniref:hypothetical protein n=1 Tax=Nocardia sp. NPDC052566 TaxID=3364330 RepID=UPI0037C87C1E
MIKPILGALALGGSFAATTCAATPAHAVEPVLSWATSFGGTSLTHFTAVPAGALFDGDIVTVQPALQPGVIGVLGDAIPFDNTCATARFLFYPKDGGAPEIVPVGTACGAPSIYFVTARRQAGDYAEVCGEVDVAPHKTTTCFRFPND